MFSSESSVLQRAVDACRGVFVHRKSADPFTEIEQAADELRARLERLRGEARQRRSRIPLDLR